MSYARLPPLGISISVNASAAIAASAGAPATAKSSTGSGGGSVANGVAVDAATQEKLERCGTMPLVPQSDPRFAAWSACVKGSPAPKPVATAPGAPCYVASKNALLSDVRKGCAVLKRGQSSGNFGMPTAFWRQFLGLPAGTVFDAALQEATKAFQKHMRLPETGQLNRETLSYTLSLPIKEGADNDDVWALHRLLGLPSEGAGAYRYKFTKYTTKRLAAYQAAMMLPVTGLVDDATRSALLAQGITPALAEAAKQATAAAKAAEAKKAEDATKKPASDGGQPAASSSSGSGSTGMLIMVGLVGLAAYFVWASPKVKRKRA